MGRNIAPVHFKTEREVETAYARRDFDQLRLNFPELGGYFPFPGNLAEVGQNHDARKAVSATL